MNSQFLSAEKTDRNIDKISFSGGKELILIGTAHVSRHSADLVETILNEEKCDTICVELDKKRFENLKNKDGYKNINIIEILKKKQGFFFMGYLLISAWQKKMSQKTGSPAGAEFRKAIAYAEKNEKKIVLADRDIGITLKRAWQTLGFFDKIKMVISALFGESEEINADSIENLKEDDALKPLLAELGKELPELKKALIDERDIYLALKIKEAVNQSESGKTAAVIGAGHVPGIIEALKNDQSDAGLSDLETVHKTLSPLKIIGWIIPVVIAAIFITGIRNGNIEEVKNGLLYWVLANGTLSALGCAMALGHPLTILTGFIAAPLTSLNPAIGAGFVTGAVQTFLKKPKVEDFMTVTEDAATLKGWYKNRLTKILLVMFLSSLGSSAGTFIFLPYLKNLF